MVFPIGVVCFVAGFGASACPCGGFALSPCPFFAGCPEFVPVGGEFFTAGAVFPSHVRLPILEFLVRWLTSRLCVGRSTWLCCARLGRFG